MKTLIETDKEEDSFQSGGDGIATPLRGESSLVLTLNTPRSKRIEQLSVERRGKRLKFLINGNRYFRGISYCLCTERVRSFDVLLQDLNRLIKDVNLPKGVQYIFSYGDKRHRKLSSLDEFKEGNIYVCSSSDHYVDLNYKVISQGFDCVGSPGAFGFNLSKSISCSAANSPSSHHHQLKTASGRVTNSLLFIRPKLVNIIISGPKPREVIKLLLNKRSVHSYDQLLTDIQTKSKTLFTPIRRVYTLNGWKVTKLKEFFADQDIFIVTAAEKCLKQDFDIHPEEYSNIHFGRFLMGKGVANVSAGPQKRSHRAQSISIPHGVNSSSSFTSSSTTSLSSSSLSSLEANSVNKTGISQKKKNTSFRNMSLDDEVFHSEENSSNIFATSFKNHNTQSESSRPQSSKTSFKPNSSSSFIPSRIQNTYIPTPKNSIKHSSNKLLSLSHSATDKVKHHSTNQTPSSSNSARDSSSSFSLIGDSLNSGASDQSSHPFIKKNCNNSNKSSSSSSSKQDTDHQTSDNIQHPLPHRRREHPRLESLGDSEPITNTANSNNPSSKCVKNGILSSNRRQIKRTDGNVLDIGAGRVIKAREAINSKEIERSVRGRKDGQTTRIRSDPSDSSVSGKDQRSNNNTTPLSHKQRCSKIPILQNDSSPKVSRSIVTPKNVVPQKNTPSKVSSSSFSRDTSTETSIPREITRKYDIGPIIGDGNFAVVHECVHKLSNKRYAMKIINKKRCRGKEASKTEVAVLRKMNHPYIIQLLEDYDFSNEMYLVMELVSGGDLFYAITTKNR